MIVGTHFHSGMNIWTTQKLEDSIAIDVTMLGKPYMLRVSAEGELPIAPLTDGVAVRGRQDCQAYSQILNIIMNQAMQSVDGMVAFGRRPRFFDHTRPVDVKELNMQIWKGFKCSAYMYENDCVFILDSCSRFLSTRSTLDDIDAIYDTFADRADRNGRGMSDDDKTRFHEAVKRELIGKSIVACYGKRQTFRVADIDFESGPCSTFFNMQDGTKVSVAKYFYKEYGLKIKNKRQPMIYVKSGKDRYLKIPAELCLVDGVPDQIRSNPKDMRTLLNQVRYNPREKMDMINGMVGKLFAAGSEALAEWGISIDAEPMKLESRRLAQPELDHHGGEQLFCTERLLKQMPVYSCKPLSERTVVLFHDREAGQDVSSILRTLESCQAQIGMSSGRIEKVPIAYPRRVLQEQQKFRDAIKRGVDDICQQARLKDPKEQLAVLFMVNHESDYHTAKKVFAEMSILTQCFTRRTGRRLNLSVASNIMKQLNQKTGGEHIRVNLPKTVTAAKTMVIGIDVCHAGKHSVCGFAASTNTACTSYYSDFIIQPKNQELIKRDLDQCLKGAL
jgi:aubergine